MKVQLLGGCSRREIYGLFTTPKLDVFPLVCLVGSSEAGPAYIKPGGDILSSEHTRSHHAQTHRSKPLAAHRPGTHPPLLGDITLPTRLVPGVRG